MQPIWVPSDEDIIKTICADSRLTYDVAAVYVVSGEIWSKIKNSFCLMKFSKLL